MATAPSPTSWTTDDDITEAGLDATEAAISFLRSPPIASLGRATDQNISNETHTALKWTTATFDSVNGHDTVTNNERYTAAYDGHYEMTVAAPIVLNGASFKAEVYFKHSDGTDYVGTAEHKTATSTTAVVSATSTIYLATGAYVEAYFWHNRGSAVQIDSSYHGGPRWTIRWVSA